MRRDPVRTLVSLSSMLAVVRGIHARFDLELLPSVEAKMKDWICAQPEREAVLARGRRRETPEDFGLDADEILEHLG